MSRDLYFRRGIRWAKVCRLTDRWYVAFGWRGSASAIPGRGQKWPTKAGAIIAAKGWIEDTPEAELELGRRRDAEERAADAKLRASISPEAWAAISKHPRPRYASK